MTIKKKVIFVEAVCDVTAGDGDLTKTIDIHSHDEFGEMTTC